MAVYGEGEPTDNAKKLYTEICNSKSSSLHCTYAVFGLGNSQCFQDRFNVVGKAVDQQLHAHGGRRLIPLGLGDASKDISAQFADWKQDLLSHMEALQTADSSSAAVAAAPSAPVQDISAASVATPSPPPSAPSAAPSVPASTVVSPNSAVPIALSTRQLAMAPEDRAIFVASVQDLKQMFTATDEINSSVAVTFDVTQAVPLDPTQHTTTGEL